MWNLTKNKILFINLSKKWINKNALYKIKISSMCNVATNYTSR